MKSIMPPKNLIYCTSQEFNGLQDAQQLDLAFIGSGLASASVFLEFARLLNAGSKRQNHQTCVFFDPDGEFAQGVAYGPKTSKQSLLITPLREFLPEPLLSEFVGWIAEHSEQLLDKVRGDFGELAQKWFTENAKKLRNGLSHDVYVPRYFFGIFYQQKLYKEVSTLTDQITAFILNDEVTSINKIKEKSENDYFEITTKDNFSFQARQTVLGIGSPPRQQLPFQPGNYKNAIKIQDIYRPSCDYHIQSIKNKFSKKVELDILIVGGNASAVEVIFQLQNSLHESKHLCNFTVINSFGNLPTNFDPTIKSKFRAENLEKLQESETAISADAIFNSFKADLTKSEIDSLNISHTLPVFTRQLSELLPRLSIDEKRKFANFHGNEIGRLQKRCGHEYGLAWQHPLSNQGVKFIKGNATSCLPDKEKRIKLKYQNNQDLLEFSSSFDVVVNCTGSGLLNEQNPSPLIVSLIKNLNLKITQSKRGFLVNDNFAAVLGLYVNGPLLSGNVIGGRCIWHVEHCGRIMSFAKEIAKNIIKNQC